jgi:hypothetical protein
MRSQVQVLAGPPAIVAGQSAVGSKPGALAGCLGRAGAARPSPPASPSAPPGPSTWAPGASITTHSGRPPIPGTAASRPVQPPPVPSRSRRRRALRTPPGLPGRPASSTAAAHARPGPGPPPTAPPTMGDLGGVARGRACDAAAYRDLGPLPWCGLPCRIGLSPMPPPDGDQTDTSGRTGATPDGRTPDGWTPDGRTPDPGRRAQVTGHRADRTLDGPDSRAPDDGTGWVDTHAGRGPATDAMAGVLACRARRRSCPLDGRWTLGWAEASGRSTNQDSSAATTTRGITLLRTGLDHRHDRQLLGRFAGQAAPRRTAVLG